MDSLETSTNVSVTIFIGIKEVTSLIHWHCEGKMPKFSRSSLYVRRSCFKNLALPSRKGKVTTVTELRLPNDQKAFTRVSTVRQTVIY